MMHANSLRAAMATAVIAFSSSGGRPHGPCKPRRLHCAGRFTGHRARVRDAAAAEERPGLRCCDVPRPRLRPGAPGDEAGPRAAPHRAAARRHRREHHRGCCGRNWQDPRISRPAYFRFQMLHNQRPH